MEFESKFPQLKFNYNLMGTLLYEPSINENACQINLDVMRKHYYQEILAAACLFFLKYRKKFRNYYRQQWRHCHLGHRNL